MGFSALKLYLTRPMVLGFYMLDHVTRDNRAMYINTTQNQRKWTLMDIFIFLIQRFFFKVKKKSAQHQLFTWIHISLESLGCLVQISTQSSEK